MLYGAIKVKMWPVFIFIWNKREHWTIFTVITIIKRLFSLCSYLALKLLNCSLDTNLNCKSQFLLQKHENLICTASLKKNFILFLFNEKLKNSFANVFFFIFSTVLDVFVSFWYWISSKLKFYLKLGIATICLNF